MGKLNRRTPYLPSNHWERINLDEKKCFVCDEPLNQMKSVYVGTKNGIKLFRHKKCNANSKKWEIKFSGCLTLYYEKLKGELKCLEKEKDLYGKIIK